MSNPKKGVEARYSVLLILGMVLYALILLALLFGKASALRRVNLIPFHTLAAYLAGNGPLALSNVLGNLLLFVPLGVYLALLNGRQPLWKNLLWALLASVAAEMVQYAFALGAADVDDVLLNTAGGLLGMGLYRLLQHWCKERTRAAVAVLSLAVGVLFLLVALCLYWGIFGVYIRI